MNKLLVLNNSTKKSPVIPNWTRDQICSVQLKLSGLMVNTYQFGYKPWFELAYQCLTSASDRLWVRQQKKLAGDTHIILEFFRISNYFYNEPNVWLNQCFSPSGEQDPTWFYKLIEEIVLDDTTGLIPIVVLDGDNGDNPIDGYPNALRQLPLVISCLDNLKNNVLYARFWDGVWYGSSRDSIPEFGSSFRTLLPNGCLAIEMQPGVIQLGDDVKTYGYDGELRHYDVVVSEFNSDIHQDSTWQIVDRMVRPFNRPSDMPSSDDPHPPYYLGQGDMNPRGKYYWIPFENKAYEWTRNWVSAEQLALERLYFQNMGCTNICW